MKPNYHTRSLALSVTIAICFYLLFIWSNDYNKIIQILLMPDISDWLLILTCSFINYLLRFFRWQQYIKSFRHSVPVMQHFLYYLSAFALTTTPAKAGEILRSFYLKPHNVKFSHSLAAFFTERLLDVFVITLLSCMIFISDIGSGNSYNYFVVSTVVVIILIIPVLSSDYLPQITSWFAKRKLNAKLSHTLQHLSVLLKSAQHLLKIKRLYPAIFVGLLAWFIQGLGFYYIMLVLQHPLTINIAISIYAISILAGAASFIPGGIGATETVMGLLLISTGADTSLAIAAPILTRLSTLWFAVSIGFIANIVIYLRK